MCSAIEDLPAPGVPAITVTSASSERPAKKPDIDNVAKAFLDAMNGTVYLDDTQVVELNIKKVYSAVAGVDVAIMESK